MVLPFMIGDRSYRQSWRFAKEAASADGPAATSWTAGADELGHGWQNL